MFMIAYLGARMSFGATKYIARSFITAYGKF